MKRLLLMTAIAASLLATQLMHADPVHFSHVDPMVNAETVVMNCTVNGVTYPVDQDWDVWAFNAYGWYIIGHLYTTAYGYAVLSNGVAYSAYCAY